jgi:xanthine/uracil permease
MYFDATPGNVSTMLVIALAVVAVVMLLKGRYDSNLPLLFYVVTLGLISITDRTLPVYLLVAGIGVALVLRFEFMGKGFTKFVGIVNTLAIGLIALVFLGQVFNDGRSFF